MNSNGRTFAEESPLNPINALLIVTIASRTKQEKPFNRGKENRSYARLCTLCAEAGIHLYITHYGNVLPDASVLSWIYRDDRWIQEDVPVSAISASYADLPQNFSEANIFRNLLVSHHIAIVNNLNLSDRLTNKMLTYELLPEFIPPTFCADTPNIDTWLKEASKHPDLSTQQLILKPQYGERGKEIEVIDFSMLTSDYVVKKKDFIVQPIMESAGGIPELGISGRHDLRMLIYNGEVFQFFVRVVAPDTHISNESHGGVMVNYKIEELPERFREVALQIDARLSAYVPRLYSIDIGVGRSGKTWVYELNTMPGAVSNEDAADDIRCAQMQQHILRAIKSCTKQVQTPQSPEYHAVPKTPAPTPTTASAATLMKRLKKDIDTLHRSHGLLMLKGGTEWEDMDMREIAILNQLRTAEIPCLIKTAGTEAKAEMRHLLEIGVDALLGPMIESEYALQKFVMTAQEINQQYDKKAILAINIETINGFLQLEAITNNPYFKEVEMVVIGRWDLANSLGIQDVESEKVREITGKIVDRIIACGKSVSIGGFVNPITAVSLEDTYQADAMNTLHCLFDVNKSPDISKSITLAHQFEIDFYEMLKLQYPERTGFYDSRIEITEKKLVQLA